MYMQKAIPSDEVVLEVRVELDKRLYPQKHASTTIRTSHDAEEAEGTLLLEEGLLLT